jgi:hypothetical protein
MKMSDTDEVVFEDPPQKKRDPVGNRRWPARFDMLRDNPGRWVNATATWGTRSAVNIIALRKRDYMDFTDITVTQRTQDDGSITVYVGYKVSHDGRGTNTERTGA